VFLYEAIRVCRVTRHYNDLLIVTIEHIQLTSDSVANVSLQAKLDLYMLQTRTLQNIQLYSNNLEQQLTATMGKTRGICQETFKLGL
jgi:hypothetical protein